MKFCLSGVLLLIPALVLAAESGTALKDDTLRKEPYADAKSAGTIKRGDKVDILLKQGAWLQIKSRQATGWVRLLSVKRGESGKANETAGVLGLASGRAGTGQVVSTTGVRGLNEEDLKSAKFNEEEVKQLEANTITAEQAQQFAGSGGLLARKIAYLPKQEGAK
jgi:uncharacterized protein YgiM (DUF1202 family)